MIPAVLPESSENIIPLMSSETKIIDGIIADLRISIDQIAIDFNTAKSLILELARRFDETKTCQQSQICRKIKDILHDKIKEGKITGKWIAECLPEEYKRKYSKRELSSLSRNAKKLEKIVIDNKGKTALGSSEADGLSIANNISSIKSEARNRKDIMQEKKSEELGILKNDNGRCAKCQELEEALLKASPMVSAEDISTNEINFTIPKEKYEELKDTMENSIDSCNLIFDKRSGLLIAAKSDITRQLSNG